MKAATWKPLLRITPESLDAVPARSSPTGSIKPEQTSSTAKSLEFACPGPLWAAERPTKQMQKSNGRCTAIPVNATLLRAAAATPNAASGLRFFQPFVIPLTLGQKMSIGCPVRCSTLAIVQHFLTMSLHTTGQNHLFRPLLGYSGQKVGMLLKKEFVYPFSRCYSLRKASSFHWKSAAPCVMIYKAQFKFDGSVKVPQIRGTSRRVQKSPPENRKFSGPSK